MSEKQKHSMVDSPMNKNCFFCRISSLQYTITPTLQANKADRVNWHTGQLVNRQTGKPANGREGFTLVELMISVALSSMVLAAAYQMVINQKNNFSLRNEIGLMLQDVRAGEQLMVREIRMAGYRSVGTECENDVTGTAFTDGKCEALEEATPHSIAFTSDVDGDGTMETVRYSVKKGSLVREMWRFDAQTGSWRRSGGARSLSEWVEGLSLHYWIAADGGGVKSDRENGEKGELLYTTQPRKEERRHITMVRLTLTARSNKPDHNYLHPLHKDHFRRVTLSSMVRLRNMGF
jgi:prepilin-type N-terminal cleavage/methylation domain-containing protein